MRKVYENFEYAHVGHYQSILESNGIATLVKNLGSEMATGIPLPKGFPEIWVLEDADYDRALALLEKCQHPDTTGLTDWTCPKCGEAVEKQFGECWNCGTDRPGYDSADSTDGSLE